MQSLGALVLLPEELHGLANSLSRRGQQTLYLLLPGCIGNTVAILTCCFLRYCDAPCEIACLLFKGGSEIPQQPKNWDSAERFLFSLIACLLSASAVFSEVFGAHIFWGHKSSKKATSAMSTGGCTGSTSTRFPKWPQRVLVVGWSAKGLRTRVTWLIKSCVQSLSQPSCVQFFLLWLFSIWPTCQGPGKHAKRCSGAEARADAVPPTSVKKNPDT